MKREEEHIDEVFKNAFAGDSYPFEESYWEDAKGMLFANPEPVASSRNWIILSALFLVTLIGFGSFISSMETYEITTTETPVSPAKNELETNSPFQVSSSNQKSSVIAPDKKMISLHKSSATTISRDVSKTDAPTSSMATHSQTDMDDQTEESSTTIPVGMMANTRGQNQQTFGNQNTNASLTNARTKNTSNGLINQTAAISNTSTSVNYGSLQFEENKPQNDVSPIKSLALIPVSEIPLSEGLLTAPENNLPGMKNLYHPISLRISSGWYMGKMMEVTPTLENTTQFNIEGSIEYHLTKHWGVQIGLGYNQYTENYSATNTLSKEKLDWEINDNSYWDYFQSPITVQDSTWWLGGWWMYPSTTDTILDSNYITQFDSTQISTWDTLTSNISSRHKVTYIELPVMGTFNMSKGRWNVQLAAGASFGFFANSSGNIIRSGDPNVVVSTQPDWFNSIQYNLLFSTEIGYTVFDHWLVTVRPQFKTPLNSKYVNGPNARFFGVQGGLLYRF